MRPIGFAGGHDDPLAGVRGYRGRRDRRALRFWIAVVAFLLGTLFGAQLHGESCLTLQVRPQVMLPMTRRDITVEVRIPRHAHHRKFAIAWTSDVGTEGSTVRDLEGEASAVLQPLLLRDQPAGHYWFTAAVFDDTGRRVGQQSAEIRSAVSSEDR
jgi:hypothetical protein